MLLRRRTTLIAVLLAVVRAAIVVLHRRLRRILILTSGVRRMWWLSGVRHSRWLSLLTVSILIIVARSHLSSVAAAREDVVELVVSALQLIVAWNLMQLLLNIVTSLTFELLRRWEEASIASRTDRRLVCSVSLTVVLAIPDRLLRQCIEGVALVLAVDPASHVGFHLVLDRCTGVESWVV